MLQSLYWLTQTLANVPERDDWLTSAERTCLAKMRFPKRRAEWRLGRWTAKRALLNVVPAPYGRMPCGRLSERMSSILNNAPQGGGTTNDYFSQIEIRAAADGAPEAFGQNQLLPITLSISHRDEIGFCVINSCNLVIGCDIERVESRSDNFVEDYFTAEEKEFIACTPGKDRPWLGTLIWSAKESALKALRQGLRLDTRSVVVSVTPAAPAAVGPTAWNSLTVRYTGTAQIFHGWWQRKNEYLQTIVTDWRGANVENPTQHAGAGFCFE